MRISPFIVYSCDPIGDLIIRGYTKKEAYGYIMTSNGWKIAPELEESINKKQQYIGEQQLKQRQINQNHDKF